MSASLNKVQLIGHLGKDPEIRSFQNGGKAATLSLATSESWKDKETGERKERTEWHRIVVFNDATLTLIELKQPPGADPGAVAYRGTDFAAAARAMGVPAATATTSEQLRDQLAGAPQGPFLVDARIDRSSYRHVLRAIRGGRPQNPENPGVRR